MGGPSTIGWPVFLVNHVVLTVVIAVVAYLIRRSNYRKYPSDWLVGWLAFALTVGSYAVTGVLFGLLFTPSIPMMMLALGNAILAWIVGNMLGDWIWWRYRKEIDGDPDAR